MTPTPTIRDIYDDSNVVAIRFKDGQGDDTQILRGSYREFYPKSGIPTKELFVATLDDRWYHGGEMIVGATESILALIFLPKDSPITLNSGV